jgi:hypothetical protein
MCDDDHDQDDVGPPVHPRDRVIEPEDPMMLEPVELDGDPEIMIDCLIEEFARMGWDAPTIVRMFDDPFYEGPYRARQRYNADAFETRVRRVLARCGTLRVRLVENDQPEEKSACLTMHGREIA